MSLEYGDNEVKEAEKKNAQNGGDIRPTEDVAISNLEPKDDSESDN